ncbi:hypothetical protein PHYPO_G00239520 [Pangasianodon hypophthalmus]|uniref:HAT C-terminal dimerisation domain-containing protein n=1 Tax=Pangasianodon hypophthalmus TaxID=310915 RepID=A0A5N5NE20_PANHP|nr:hypothetical protein PHYPO_G00239520 [Pangasianodon hypophthalmus]
MRSKLQRSLGSWINFECLSAAHPIRLATAVLHIPVSTAACEHTFSTLKLVKSYLRSTMNDDGLSHLGVLSVESRRAKSLNLDEFVNFFALNHNNHRIQLM